MKIAKLKFCPNSGAKVKIRAKKNPTRIGSDLENLKVLSLAQNYWAKRFSLTFVASLPTLSRR